MTEKNFEEILIELSLNTIEHLDTIDVNLSMTEQGFDSLDMNSFLLEVESQFDVVIADEDLQDLNTIRKLADYLRRQN